MAPENQTSHAAVRQMDRLVESIAPTSTRKAKAKMKLLNYIETKTFEDRPPRPYLQIA